MSELSAIRVAESCLTGAPELAEVLNLRQMAASHAGVREETVASRLRRRRAKGALGRLLAQVQLRAARYVLRRLPNTAPLLELGVGLDPLRWVASAGGARGRFDVVVRCTSAGQRSTVEAQAESAGIPHSRAPVTPEVWWAQVGRDAFPGATEATWEIVEAYAAAIAPQLGRLLELAGSTDRLRTTIERWAATQQAVADDAGGG